MHIRSLRSGLGLRRLLNAAVAALAIQGVSMGNVFAQALPFEEFSRNWGLNNIGVLWPWGAGATGSGVSVAVIDSGVDSSHPDLSGQVLPGIDFVDGDGFAADLTAASHGTFVSGLIAGNRNGSGIVGVAYDAKILPIRVTDQSQSFTEQNLAAGINFAANSNARVVNIAIASDAPRSPEVLAALQRAAGANKLIVMPAGNTGSAGVLFPAFFASSLGGAGLIAGAIGPDGQIASFSNRAGSNLQHYVLAPGVDVQSSTRGGGFTTSSGTSWATSFVSGAAAVLLGAFPGLDAQDAAKILKETATDLGAPGPDSTYGWGVINLRNAMAPQGTLQVPGGSSGDGGGSGGGAGAVAVAALAIGGAVAWNSARKKKDLKTALIIDKYGRGYNADIASLIHPNDDQHSLSSVMAGLGHTTRSVGLNAEDVAAVVLDFSTETVAPTINEISFDPERLSKNDWRAAFDQSIGEHFQFAYRRNAAYGLPSDESSDLAFNGGMFNSSVAAKSAFLNTAGSMQAVALNWHATPGVALGFGIAENTSDERFATESDVASIDFAFNATRALTFGIRLSETQEDGGFLGGRSGGALSVDEATTSAVRFSARYALSKRFSLLGAWQIGRTKVFENKNAIISNVSTIRSRAWGVGLMAHSILLDGDAFGISLTRPLRVSSGSALLDVPTGFGANGELTRNEALWDLAPEDRETDVEIFYRRPLSERSSLGTYLLYRDNAFNSAEYGDDIAGLMTYRRRF